VRCICLRVVVIVGGGLARRRRTGARHAAMREAPLEKRWMAVVPACCHFCARIVTKVPSISTLHFPPRTLASKLREPAELGPERLGGSRVARRSRNACHGGGASETENEGGATERRRGQAGEATGATSEALHNPTTTR